ncbi:hypothetical protein ACQEU5_15330 [Marinactinospora thermotolerans]|uniref:Uncharacterized protein n=1 Tax=Marinactinospora thermotolerans DSM 45154 TaxID=1122192 RepID=A0A1T4T7Z0_9ACTN|nr:hypothetical protein [Marinactinospora thermotolerans]SKA36595.1 hypothetical protein SAMN02745673_04608 [Marinactinospora thermotolerans DSM 45154]
MSTVMSAESSPLTGEVASGHRVTLFLDPVTRAEVEKAVGEGDISSHLAALVGRYVRWNETREWLSALESAYGKLPPEALERLYRQMLGLPRSAGSEGRSLTITLDAEEFAALDAQAGDRPMASYAREVLLDHITGSAGQDGGTGPSDDSGRGAVAG